MGVRRVITRGHIKSVRNVFIVVELSDPPEPEIGEITLRSRQRLRSSDPTTLKAMRRTALSKSMR